MYRERRSQVRGAVLWTQRPLAVEDLRVLPDGCMDLIWSADGSLFVAGPDTGPQHVVLRPDAPLTGIRFAPGDLPRLLGIPAFELVDRRVPLAEIVGDGQSRQLADRIAAAEAPDVALEAIALERILAAPDGRPVLDVVRLLRHGRTVDEVAALTGRSTRSLLRLSRSAFGYGPKMLARVLRLQRALEQARAGIPFVDVAHQAGYADQPHLSREVRRLAGVPLSELVG